MKTATPTWWKTNSEVTLDLALTYMGNLVSTEKEELKHDRGGRHSTTTSHGREKFAFLALKMSKPYRKLSQYTKLKKLLATESVKSK